MSFQIVGNVVERQKAAFELKLSFDKYKNLEEHSVALGFSSYTIDRKYALALFRYKSGTSSPPT